MANGRIGQEDTPTGRLAAVFRMLEDKSKKEHRMSADYADFREAEPYIERELILARIAEARIGSIEPVPPRVIELSKRLYEIEKVIPKEQRLYAEKEKR